MRILAAHAVVLTYLGALWLIHRRLSPAHIRRRQIPDAVVRCLLPEPQAHAGGLKETLPGTQPALTSRVPGVPVSTDCTAPMLEATGRAILHADSALAGPNCYSDGLGHFICTCSADCDFNNGDFNVMAQHEQCCSTALSNLARRPVVYSTR